MKMKYIFSIIIITALCLGKINSQTSIPADLSLYDTQTFNKDYDALNSIESTQVINNGVTTTYTAGDEIVLKPGFHAKAGSEFTAKIEDVSNRITIMTTNLHRRKYAAQAENILLMNPDVVAVQEIGYPRNNFNRMKEKTGYGGVHHATDPLNYIYGIGLLWKPSLGTVKIIPRSISTSSQDEFFAGRAYIIAVFTDFCVVATHYATTPRDRKKMTRAILNDTVVTMCKNFDKPVYIAGDLNDPLGEDGVKDLKDAGFEVLNDYSSSRDMILEYNTNPDRALINNDNDIAIPLPLITIDQWLDEANGGISDHLPRYVRVKFK